MQDFEWQSRIFIGRLERLFRGIPRNVKWKLKFWTITGEVISSAKRSDTYVSGSTSGYNGQVYGNVSSNVVVAHEFWLRKPDGTEEEIQITGYDIPLREGQKVTMLLAHPEGETNSKYVALINHSAGKYWMLDKSIEDLMGSLDIDKSSKKWVLMKLGIVFAVLYFPDPDHGEFALEITAFYGAFLFVRSVMREGKIDEKHDECERMLIKHIQGLAEEILRRGAGAEAPAADAAPASAVPEPAGA